MDLKEITDLINIRQYVVNSTGNPAIDRATVNAMNGTLILLDKKIMSILTGEEFREYIGYANVRKAIEEIAQITNIKSGLNNPKR
jgi:hypothetical protein